ncbi:MAG: substrate-binding domain-containing protein [Oscillospiraceae bacterium]
MNKRILALILAASAVLGLAGCKKDSSEKGAEAVFDGKKEITVISREDGSGTRGAFTELCGISEKVDGKTVDRTVDTADITQSTGVMLSAVGENEYAVGYVSLGSLSDSVKALTVDGVKVSKETVKDKTYKISRPFNIATVETISPQTEEFIKFIMSTEGQAVVENEGYVSVGNGGDFKSEDLKGKITIAGSSSVTPVMEKLKEAYEKINPNVTIEINQSDSTSGMKSAADGICDIGMASREIKESELAKGLKAKEIAMDGIAVIVNKQNPLNDISPENIKNIYVGSFAKWEEVK